jgi:hypothetical protein
LIPIRDTYTTTQLASLFVKEWCLKGYGLPLTVISDRDKIFVSALWQAIFKALGVTLLPSTARHQETDGITERAIRTLKDMLRSYAAYQGLNWVENLPNAAFAMNNAPAAATGFAPFRLAFGLEPRWYASTSEGASKFVEDLHARVEQARLQIATAQDRMIKSANQRRSSARPLQPGQLAWLHREGVHWPADSQQDSKLLPRYLGPFRVLTADQDRGNYTLELPHTLRIHPVFHERVLVPYKEPSLHFADRNVPVVEPEAIDPERDYEVEAILDHRKRRRTKEYLIRGAGYDSNKDAWVPEQNLAGAPDLLKEYLQARGGVAAVWRKA